MVEAKAQGAQVVVYESHWGARSVNTALENNFGANLDYFQAHVLNAIATANPLSMQVSNSWLLYSGDSNVINPLLEFAAQGQSFYEASGDLNKGQWLAGINTLPYVTAVSGTDLGVAIIPPLPFTRLGETAWPGSSGGVANNQPGQPAPPDPNCLLGSCASPFYNPTYIEQAIPFFQSAVGGQADPFSRSVPDVTMPANGLVIVINGGNLGWTGTSAAAPLFAGFTALINQEAAENGLLSLGQPNPVLYALASPTTPTTANPVNALYGQLFNDITSGQQAFDGLGYSAAPGYDFLTGLGSPQCALIDQLASVNPLAPHRKIRILSNKTIATDDPVFPTGFEDFSNNTQSISAATVQPGLPVSFGIDDFTTITTNGGLGGITVDSTPTIDMTCDPGGTPSATVSYSYCVSLTGPEFVFDAEPDIGDGSSASDPTKPVGSADQFTMMVTCDAADAAGLMHVHVIYQLWNGCGVGRIPTGQSDYAVESGGGCGVFGLGQCYTNLSRRQIDFYAEPAIGTITDPDVCFENKTHFNNANGCDDNHVQATDQTDIPTNGIVFINTSL